MKKKVWTVLAAIAALAVFVAAGSAAAATHKVAVDFLIREAPGNPDGGEFVGKPFGTGALSERKTGPGIYKLTFRAKAGNVVFALKGKRQDGGEMVGTWIATAGTGKYQGIAGKGKWFGNGGSFDLIGKVAF